MAITVSDCLRLPSLREAKVVAGHKGLNKFVTTVSVLEYAKICFGGGILFGKRADFDRFYFSKG